MRTPEQRLEEFKERLADLMEEYDAILEVRNVGVTGRYPLHHLCIDLWDDAHRFLLDETGHSMDIGITVTKDSLRTP